MYDNRKTKACQLRQSGMSIKAIAKELGAAQSSVSIWTREIALTEGQRAALDSNSHTKIAIEKRRQARLLSEEKKRSKVINTAKSSIGSITHRELLLICTALYWAEGTKKRGSVQFSNGDPDMISLMLYFLREVCEVDESKLRAYIHIHEHLDVKAAEDYWSSITGIPHSQFYKTYNKKNISSKGTRNSLPYGVCDIYVHDTNLFLKIRGWRNGIVDSIV